MRLRLAEMLHAVVSQRLLPKKDGRGRAVACEVMIVTPTIKELMLDRDRVSEIRDYIAEGREQYGMQTFDQHLTRSRADRRSRVRSRARRGDTAERLRAEDEHLPAPFDDLAKAVTEPIAEPMTGAISLGTSGSAVTGAQAIVPPPAASPEAAPQEFRDFPPVSISKRS